MNGTLFIHKFQPLWFKDFETQPEMIELLNTFIQIDNLNIIFVGNMGGGKSTILNAMIREYYKGYTEKQYADNILNINSLKDQGVQYYRSDVKTFCQNCSVIKKKKKFVILDDIDYINEQSQQVFRNYIDKYSHNVHFVSSCNNIQKVIESLQSRFTIMKLRPLQRENLIHIIHKVVQSENIELSPDAESYILDICNNTAKILLNYLEKCKLLQMPITLDLAVQVCTNISFSTFQEYTLLAKENKLHDAIQLIYSIYDKGYSVMDILDNYFLFVKTTTMLTEDEKYSIIPCICKYISIFHNIHEDEIELALFTNNISTRIK